MNHKTGYAAYLERYMDMTAKSGKQNALNHYKTLGRNDIPDLRK